MEGAMGAKAPAEVPYFSAKSDTDLQNGAPRREAFEGAARMVREPARSLHRPDPLRRKSGLKSGLTTV